MEVIILGLKNKKNNSYIVYDVTQDRNHISIKLGETLTIKTLDPFPFSNFSSLDVFDADTFERCYLKVEAEISHNEFHSMQSCGIAYHRFNNRSITFLSEFENIFQYSYDMFKKFGKKLGTYDLLTWVIHNETKNEEEFEAMKKIIFNRVTDKKNKEYPLDISLDEYTFIYMDYFAELSEKGYKISFGRYGSMDRQFLDKYKKPINDKTFLFILKNVSVYDFYFFNHPNFTFSFYENFIKDTEFEKELFFDLKDSDLETLSAKGFDIDSLYKNFFDSKVKEYNEFYYDGDFFGIFSDPDYKPNVIRKSPFDYYCCEDCDGYDIYERYSEEELEGYDVIEDERADHFNELIHIWSNHLSSKSYPLFEEIPTDFLNLFSQIPFVSELLSERKK